MPRTSYKGVTPRAARSRRVLALTLAVVQFLYPAFASAQAIVADGRTQTAVNATGEVVNVTTGTVSGANAFNSFSKFGVEQGITANLFLPGDNVWFANPYGFVVEAGGVVDVGGLSVVTPTERFVDRRIRVMS